jgi:PAS domain S-box-containing protein
MDPVWPQRPRHTTSVPGYVPPVAPGTLDRAGDGSDEGAGDRRAIMAVRAVCDALSVMAHPEEALRAMAAAASGAIGAATATVVAVEGGRLDARTFHGVHRTVEEDVRSLPLDDSTPTGVCVRSGEVVVVHDRAELEATYPALAAFPTGAGSWVVAPMRLAERVVGALGFGFADEGPVHPTTRQAIEDLAPLFALASHWYDMAALETAYRTLVEANVIGVSVATPFGIVAANAAFLEMMGLTTADLESSAIDWSAMTPPEYRAIDEAAIDSLRRTGRSGPYEKEQVRRDGTVVPVRIGAALLERDPLRWVAFVEDLTEERRRIAELHELHARLRAEVSHQRDALISLQAAFLPDGLTDVRGIDIAARYLPAETDMSVGGDWYDVVLTDDDVAHLVIGDVAGSGLAAAATMGELRNALRGFLLSGDAPADAFQRLDRLLRTGGRDDIATAAVASVAADRRSVAIVSAGHLPPLRITGRGAAPIWPARAAPPLGVGGAAPRPTAVTRVEPGDRLVLYTDGLIERRSTDIDVRIGDLCEAAGSSPRDCERTADALLSTMLRATPRTDDTCLLVARVTDR